MPSALSIIAVLWIVCAVTGAAFMSRVDRSGTGFLLGVLLGPIGLAIVWIRRPHWERDCASKAAAREIERKEQAQREWRGY